MRQSLTVTALLLATAFFAAPAGAQVAGNAGDLHTATPYMAQQWTNKPATPASGAPIDLFAPFSALSSVGATTSSAAGQHGCTASQDFNGRYTASCAP